MSRKILNIITGFLVAGILFIMIGTIIMAGDSATPYRPDEGGMPGVNMTSGGGETQPQDPNMMPMPTDQANPNMGEMGAPDMAPDGAAPPDGYGGGAGEPPPAIVWYYYVFFGIESLVLAFVCMFWFMSKFHTKTFKEMKKDSDKFIILILSSLIMTSFLIYLDGYIAKNLIYTPQPMGEPPETEGVDMNDENTNVIPNDGTTDGTNTDGGETVDPNATGTENTDNPAANTDNQSNTEIPAAPSGDGGSGGTPPTPPDGGGGTPPAIP